MKRVSFYVQVGIFAVALISLVFNGEEGMMSMLISLFFLGVVQLIDASISTLRRYYLYPLNTRLNQYWLAVVAFFTLLFTLGIDNHLWFQGVVLIGGSFLGIYYMWLSYRGFQLRKPRSKFFPNTSWE